MIHREGLHPGVDLAKPSLIRRILAPILCATALSGCGMPRAEINAADVEVRRCNNNTPLTTKSWEENAEIDLAKITEEVSAIHNRTLEVGGSLDFARPDPENSKRDNIYGFRAEKDALELRMPSADSLTLDKVQFPFEDGRPKEIQLGTIACTDEKLYPTEVNDYIHAGYKASSSLDQPAG